MISHDLWTSKTEQMRKWVNGNGVDLDKLEAEIKQWADYHAAQKIVDNMENK